MSKIFALYTNEMIKISKKISVLVIAILVVITAFGFSGVMKLLEPLLLSTSDIMSTSEDNYEIPRQYLADAEAYFDEYLKETNGEEYVSGFRLEAADDLLIDDETIAALQSDVDTKEFMLNEVDWNVVDVNRITFVTYIESILQTFYFDYWNQYMVPIEDRDEAWTARQNELLGMIDELKVISNELDFKAYIAFYKANENQFVTDANADVYFFDSITNYGGASRLDTWYDYDPTGGIEKDVVGELTNAFSTIEIYQTQLDNNVLLSSNLLEMTTTTTPLSEEKREEIENKLSVLQYRIDNHLLVLDSESGIASMSTALTQSFVKMLITVLVIIIAGSTISSEMATGSIKSLIIAPVKRWKIFTAKLLSIITVVLVSSIFAVVFSMLGTIVFFGTKTLVPYVYVNGSGVIHTMPHLLYQFLYFIVSCVDVLFYALIAFAFSSVFNNTALAVAISMGVSYMTSIVNQLLMLFTHQRWIDFLPISNMDFITPLFPYYTMMNSSSLGLEEATGMLTTPSPIFSLCYCIVLFFCLIYIAKDQFCRKDIQ